MSEVYYLSDIGTSSIDLVQKYMTIYFPNATMELLSSNGLMGACKRKIPDSSCVLAVIDKELSAEIDEKGYSYVFDLDKVHRYTSYDDLLEIMINTFGVDLSDKEKDTLLPPDKLGKDLGLDAFFDTYNTTDSTEEDILDAVEEKEKKSVEETKTEEIKSVEKTNIEEIKSVEESVEESNVEETTEEELKVVEETNTEEIKSVEESVEESKEESTVVEEDTTEETKSVEEDNIEEIKSVEEPHVEESKTEEIKSVEDSKDVEEPEVVEEDKLEDTKGIEESKVVEEIKEETSDTSIEDVEHRVEENNKSISEIEDVDFGVSLEKQETVNVKVINDDVEVLKDKLIQAQLTITSLSSQLSELEDSNDEVLLTRIEVLTRQLESKENEIKTLREFKSTNTENVDVLELTELREELIRVKESKATLEYDKKKVQTDLELSETRIQELQSSSITLEEQIKALNRQIVSNESKIERLQNDIKTKDAIIADKVAEIDVLTQKKSELLTKVKELTQQLDDVKSELTTVKLERDNLKADLDKVNAELEQANNTIEEKDNSINEVKKQLEESLNHANDLTDTLSELREQVQQLRNDIELLTSEKEKALSEVEDKGKTIVRLNEEITEIKDRHTKEIEVLNGTVETLTNKASKAKDFKEEINTLNDQVTNLNTQISDLNAQLSNKNSIIESKNSELSIKDTELRGYEEREKVTQERLESKDRAYEEIIKAKDLMEQDLNSRLMQSNTIIEQLRDTLKGKESELNDLTANNSKLTNEISSLTETLDSQKPDITASATLEQELFEAKKTIAKLQNENTELKENGITKEELESKTLRVSELEEEIQNLQQNHIQDRNDNAQLVDELKRRNAELEISLASKTQEVDGIYMTMKKMVGPKVPCNMQIDNENNISYGNNFMCVVSGSNESIDSTYNIIKRTCMKYPKKRFLILDLVTETSIDRVFNMAKVDFPRDWLENKSDFKKYVNKTSLDNTCVISTGLSYLNDVFLLNCNILEKLQELSVLDATIIVHIGCLNNLVSKILFNTLNPLMKTIVIAKATPINIRNVILAMTGLNVTDKVRINCLDYDEKTSKNLYLRLAEKYNSSILQGDEVLSIEV